MWQTKWQPHNQRTLSGWHSAETTVEAASGQCLCVASVYYQHCRVIAWAGNTPKQILGDVLLPSSKRSMYKPTGVFKPNMKQIFMCSMSTYKVNANTRTDTNLYLFAPVMQISICTWICKWWKFRVSEWLERFNKTRGSSGGESWGFSRKLQHPKSQLSDPVYQQEERSLFF